MQLTLTILLLSFAASKPLLGDKHSPGGDKPTLGDVLLGLGEETEETANDPLIDRAGLAANAPLLGHARPPGGSKKVDPLVPAARVGIFTSKAADDDDPNPPVTIKTNGLVNTNQPGAELKNANPMINQPVAKKGIQKDLEAAKENRLAVKEAIKNSDIAEKGVTKGPDRDTASAAGTTELPGAVTGDRGGPPAGGDGPPSGEIGGSGKVGGSGGPSAGETGGSRPAAGGGEVGGSGGNKLDVGSIIGGIGSLIGGIGSAIGNIKAAAGGAPNFGRPPNPSRESMAEEGLTPLEKNQKLLAENQRLLVENQKLLAKN